MKSSWHVYNLKRKIASLPSISLDIFKDQIEKAKPESPKRKGEEKAEETPAIEESDEEDVGSPRQCLFCPQKFDDDSNEFESTLEHMYTVHGLFIPDPSMISDLESFLGYLATGVRVWHECLYCGTTRNSTQAIQSHMRDSSHCMLNMEREPELLEFWEPRSDGEDDIPSNVAKASAGSGKELQLLSGKKVGSRADPRRRMRTRDTSLILRNDIEPSLSASSASPGPSEKQSFGHRQLARREEMSLRNIDPQQRHALVLAEKRSQVQESVASRARDWSYARKANKQKHDQAHGPLAWAKGGMHNLLPR